MAFDDLDRLGGLRDELKAIRLRVNTAIVTLAIAVIMAAADITIR
jgi:hypothetical protein